ncbi:MAG: hemerythrin domain-containing protein [Sporomusaceae bacterium]|nr:hemerythrin domain-containing protein [Sporomusaceae bacterium]
MDIDNLLRQHHDILALVGELEKYKTGDLLQNNAVTVAKSLAQLAGILKMHLSSEDKFLYPKLLQNTDATIHTTAKLFINEMGTLGQSFETYKMSYMGASKITAQADNFIKETQSICAAIRERMNKEEHDLYPLLK